MYFVASRSFQANVILLFIQGVTAPMKKYVIDQMCTSAAETSHDMIVHGAVFSWDGGDTFPKTFTTYPDVTYVCSFTYRSDISGFHGAKTKIGVRFRPAFTVASALRSVDPRVDDSDTDCTTASIRISSGSDEPIDKNVPSGPICGVEPPSDFETSNKALTFSFHFDFGIPPDLNLDEVTISDYLPRVFFNIEITTFVQDCVSKANLLVCPQSGRCLHNSTVCDKFGAYNCLSPAWPSDVSDQNGGPPSYCAGSPTTTSSTTTTSTTTRSTTTTSTTSTTTPHEVDNTPSPGESTLYASSTTESSLLTISTPGEPKSSKEVKESSLDLRPIWVTMSLLLVGITLIASYWIYMLHIWPYMKKHDVLDRLQVFFHRLPALCVAFFLSIPDRLRRLWRRLGGLMDAVTRPQDTGNKMAGPSTIESTRIDAGNAGSVELANGRTLFGEHVTENGTVSNTA